MTFFRLKLARILLSSLRHSLDKHPTRVNRLERVVDGVLDVMSTVESMAETLGGEAAYRSILSQDTAKRISDRSLK